MTNLLPLRVDEEIKVQFCIGMRDKLWNYIHNLCPSIDTIFQYFPDVEVVEVGFIRKKVGATHAVLSKIPEAWAREDGILEVYSHGEDEYGLSGQMLTLADQISPIDVSYFEDATVIDPDVDHFSLALTPSACLVLCNSSLEDFEVQLGSSIADIREIVGFTSKLNPGGNKQQRLQAQMASVCQIFSELGMRNISLDKVTGSITKENR